MADVGIIAAAAVAIVIVSAAVAAAVVAAWWALSAGPALARLGRPVITQTQFSQTLPSGFFLQKIIYL